MKKMLKVIIPLALISLFLSSQLVTANFGVDIGDTFTYDCVAAERTMTIGSNTGTATGYTVDDHEFAEGTSVVVEVLEFDDSLFNATIYEKQAGSYVENGSSSTFGFQLGGLLMTVFPLFFALGFVDENTWNQTEAEEGPGMILEPFVEPEAATWTLFADFAAEVQTGTSLLSDPSMSGLSIQAEYTDSVSEFFFESYLTGTYNDSITNGTHTFLLNYDVDHNFQFAFNKANGVMKGMRIEGSLEGTSNSTVVEISYNMHTELAGYNLPN
ncbi:MAG: hypothetical protein KAS22_12955, partial [Candidatus Heimdallarchaeota archaeon]|nr:hypothetical protein [Candidatus Heimdallarchaeota archaeon]